MPSLGQAGTTALLYYPAFRLLPVDGDLDSSISHSRYWRAATLQTGLPGAPLGQSPEAEIELSCLRLALSASTSGPSCFAKIDLLLEAAPGYLNHTTPIWWFGRIAVATLLPLSTARSVNIWEGACLAGLVRTSPCVPALSLPDAAAFAWGLAGPVTN